MSCRSEPDPGRWYAPEFWHRLPARKANGLPELSYAVRLALDAMARRAPHVELRAGVFDGEIGFAFRDGSRIKAIRFVMRPFRPYFDESEALKALNDFTNNA